MENNMQHQQLYEMLTTAQKTDAAKVAMIISASIERCSTIDEVAKFITYITERARQAGINKILNFKGQFLEVVTGEPVEEQKEKIEDNAIEETKPD